MIHDRSLPGSRLALGFVGLALMALVFPLAPARAADLYPITFQLNYPAAGFNAGFELAVKNGYYKDAGLDVKIEPGNGSQITAQLLAAGKVDLGFAREGLSLSLKTGDGLEALEKMLQQKLQQKLEGDGAPLLTRPRHVHALQEAREHLRHGLHAPDGQPELLAEDLRLAMRAIGRITGRVDVEELLDFVFRDFCVGK